MYKPDENDIDRLSRDAAERYTAPGNPAWDKLQQTLDRELPQEKEKKRRGFFFFTFLLLGLSLAGSVVWYGIHNNKTGDSIDYVSANAPKASKANASPKKTENGVLKGSTGSSSSPVLIEPGKKEIPSGIGANAAVPGQEKNIPAASSSVINAAIQSKRHNAPTTVSIAALRNTTAESALKENKAHFKTAGTVPGGTTAGNSVRTAAQNKKLQPDLFLAAAAALEGNQKKNTPAGNQSSLKKLPEDAVNNGDKHIAATDAGVPNNDIKSNTGTASKNIAPPATHAATDTMNSKPASVAETDVDKPAPVVENAASAKATAVKKKSKAKNDKAILLGLIAGLDQSTIKFTYSSGLGYNIGFMGGYQFSKHWSVYTGLVYTKKNYKLNGSDFHPPKHYWTTYVNLQTVDGYCRMWELPLQARYTFNPSARMPFFASAGLSSYFMKKQAYDYYYKTNAGMPGSGAWSTDSSMNHAFSILHLSAGIQKQLGKHMNWQIEPYAKIPLGGVGFGSIRLSSFGVNLSVQYKKSLKASSSVR